MVAVLLRKKGGHKISVVLHICVVAIAKLVGLPTYDHEVADSTPDLGTAARQLWASSVKSFTWLTRKTILITLNQPKQHTVLSTFRLHELFTPMCLSNTPFKPYNTFNTTRGNTYKLHKFMSL